MSAPQHNLPNPHGVEGMTGVEGVNGMDGVDEPSGVNDQLVAAVMAKDADAVRACLNDGADPDTPGPDGLPLLCTAVGAFDHETAHALTDGGADSCVVLPDGTTPLMRAVDLGSPALVGATLGRDPGLRITAAEKQRLLALARHWCETGEAEELRRRTGAPGPAARRPVQDDEYTDIEEVSLGGLTVRAGHRGVLTDLERAFGILSPVSELVARAAPDPGELHANWSSVSYALAFRKSPQAWSELAALRHHPDPVHRRLLAKVLWSRNFLANFHNRPDTAGDVEFLAAWALDEPDGEVLADVLDVYTDHDHPGQEAVAFRYAGHPDPRVRRQVPYCLMRTPMSEPAVTTLLALARDPDSRVRYVVAEVLAYPRELTPATRRNLLTLLRDPDADVRRRAAESLSGSHDRTAAVTEALAALLDEEDRILRLEAAYGLAVRDDPRTDEAYERVGPLGPGFEDDHRVSAHWHYRHRNRAGGT
ncbi:HEAT repeat domain-containing protein [Streptomyces sp. SP2-10]|uniref:HEAT repeat domain-containing protein n=1 Tax=Streptomyces sp. SP2-10 TaxID=2873385 RepID=UPI00223BD952|nr:HEAT repeat domain-containing protein [Streptomyces sp. SP2-10]